MFYEGLNGIHLHQLKMDLLDQLVHSYLLHPCKLDHHYDELLLLFSVLMIQKHHVLMDMLSLEQQDFQNTLGPFQSTHSH